MSKTKNLGQVSGVFIGTSAPQNTTIIWYDDTPNQKCHKVYDSATNTWKALSPDIVSNTTYSELVSNAQRNGLSIGKYYIIRDKSNVLAIAITTTKVQYSDTLGNIIVDDLGTNIQYHVSSGNLLIDDLSGVFNTETNKLVFTFKEQSNINTETDYLFGKVRSGTRWILSKFRFSSLLSKESNNSISWRNGFFFSFKNAINGILNKVGGVVGYDSYSTKIEQIDKNIQNISKNNQTIITNAEQSITEKTTDTVIFGKKIQGDIDVTTAPGDVLRGDTLFTIVSKFQRWINRFKYANGINISRNFTDAGTKQFINNNDTVETAFGKIQYMLKNPTTSSSLPEDWTIGAKREDGGFADLNDDAAKRYTAFNEDGFPVAGDSIFYAFAKIVDFMQGGGRYSKLSSEWKEMSYTGDIEFPKSNDAIDVAFSKIVAKIKQLGDISYGKLVFEKIGSPIKTIFDLYEGSLTFEFNDGGGENKCIINSEKISVHNGIKGIDITNRHIVMGEEGDNFFVVDEEDDITLTAYNNSFDKRKYDAYFRRLKINNLTIEENLIVQTPYYIDRIEAFCVYVGTTDGHLLLPEEPENGTIIMIQSRSSKVTSVIAQSDDRFDDQSNLYTVPSYGAPVRFIYTNKTWHLL